ncbi:aminoacyl-tRNA hydrolase [Sphingobacterium sp. DK4209]|uniref:Aminoacyl-tRNA hydrolase n=1 Tax=Sphingobacterium zhuxiongii TaxID=2662364 RepID=A0A5Q0QCJ6_9SPHI|nr:MULTISPECIES: alternative ribosome rescue aminoacyl-tRNA hydrolase ArfB [unclassified Sphingobacterium]MVZ66647.1 aminoacyl-tRNA hydrolase [Sphingobacterium sp. DK4209]QGA25418.1 aminoacyl-tRNA hydrolase [Sphingobacterium sp. dk4302]
MDEQILKLVDELQFKTSRAGGKGGQNVNKVSSKVMLIWQVDRSSHFTIEQKELLKQRLANRINNDGELLLDAFNDRSQLRNKEIVIERFLTLIGEALKIEKPRIPTKIPKSKILARLDRKKIQSSKKANRRWKLE